MNANPEPHPTDLTTLIERLWEMVKTQEAPTISEALRVVWMPDLTDDSYDEALFAGIVKLAHARQGERRRDGRPAIAFGVPHGRHWKPYMRTLATPFQDAEGREKSLLDFGDEDWDHYEAICAVNITGWEVRRAAARSARRMMREQKVTRTRDLSEDSLVALAEAFDKAFA